MDGGVSEAGDASDSLGGVRGMLARAQDAFVAGDFEQSVDLLQDASNELTKHQLRARGVTEKITFDLMGEQLERDLAKLEAVARSSRNNGGGVARTGTAGPDEATVSFAALGLYPIILSNIGACECYIRRAGAVPLYDRMYSIVSNLSYSSQHWRGSDGEEGSQQTVDNEEPSGIVISEDTLSILFVALRSCGMYNAVCELQEKNDQPLVDLSWGFLSYLLAHLGAYPTWLSVRVAISSASMFLRSSRMGSCIEIGLVLRAIRHMEEVLDELKKSAGAGAAESADKDSEVLNSLPEVIPTFLMQRTRSFPCTNMAQIRFWLHIFRARLAQLEFTNAFTKSIKSSTDTSLMKRFRKEVKLAMSIAAEDLEPPLRQFSLSAALMLKASAERNGPKALKMLVSAAESCRQDYQIVGTDVAHVQNFKAILLNNIGIVHVRLQKYALASSYFTMCLKSLLNARKSMRSGQSVVLPVRENIAYASNNLALQWMREKKFEPALDAFSVASNFLGTRSPWFWYRLAECAVHMHASRSSGHAHYDSLSVKLVGFGPYRRMMVGMSVESQDACQTTEQRASQSHLLDLALTALHACMSLLERHTIELPVLISNTTNSTNAEESSDALFKSSFAPVAEKEQLEKLQFAANLLVGYVDLCRSQFASSLNALKRCLTMNLDDGLVCTREQLLLLNMYAAEAHCGLQEPEQALKYLPLEDMYISHHKDATRSLGLGTLDVDVRVAVLINASICLVQQDQLNAAWQLLGQAEVFLLKADGGPGSSVGSGVDLSAAGVAAAGIGLAHKAPLELVALQAYLQLRLGRVDEARNLLHARAVEAGN